MLLGAAVGLAFAQQSCVAGAGAASGALGLVRNEIAIRDWNANFDVGDTREVFRRVFTALPERVTVYPTENYYYVQFTAAGRDWFGSLRLSAHNRDAGVLGFSYIERVDKLRQWTSPSKGGGGDLGKADGVSVRKINDWTYEVGADGRRVTFRLNDPGLAPPVRARLREPEEFVGPSVDESGLRFFLIFNRALSRLFWILNEETPAADELVPGADGLLFGKRTDFAFYDDREHDRRILVGVHGLNVLQNNWYDGPFDQMPDNLVYTRRIEVRPYLEAAFPEHRGKIDRYGRFLHDPTARIPVGNCTVYFRRRDLDFVRAARAEAKTPDEFYERITRQVFVVPKGLGQEVEILDDVPK